MTLRSAVENREAAVVRRGIELERVVGTVVRVCIRDRQLRGAGRLLGFSVGKLDQTGVFKDRREAFDLQLPAVVKNGGGGRFGLGALVVADTESR